MTRIKVFKTYTVLLKFFIVIGSITTLLGLFMIIKAFASGFNTKFPSGDWNAVIFIFQGLLFILVGTANLINRKYYIEWDDKELHILLPDSKKVETIKFDEIDFVKIKLFEIHLILRDRTRILDLNSLQFEDLKKIKERFETISKLDN